MVRAAALLALAAALSAPAGPAQAAKLKLLKFDGPITKEAAEDDKKDAKKKSKAIYRAVIDYGVAGLTEDKFLLKDSDDEKIPPVAAVKVDNFTTQTEDKLVLVVLVQADEAWMGNEMYNQERPMPGGFAGLPDALSELANGAPPGSLGALITYGGDVTIKYAMGDISGIGGALGTQKNYEGKSGVPFIAGLQQSYNLLTGSERGRKVLVVFGDGTDIQADIGSQVDEEAKKLQSAGIEVFSVYFGTISAEDPTFKKNMQRIGFSGGYEAPDFAAFKSKAADIIARLRGRYYVDFPADPFATPDEKPRAFVIAVDKDETEEPVSKATLKLKSQAEGGSLWWLWILLPVLLIAIIVIVLVMKRKKPEPVYEAPPEPVAAAPAGPSKTVMLGIGGDDAGIPIVGWIVPLSGPHQFQTFKLLPGLTKLGTGGAAHIHINDQFMSTEHAEILCSPAGFILKDANSTNGVFVNQKRISAHELVDNDVFTMGRTDFKFKSIN